jgi:hypothetical protein
MSITPDQLHISISDEGRLLANAVVASDSDPSNVRASLHVESGHVPPATRGQLVDALLEITQAQPGTSLQITFPVGEAEILEQMRQRCREVEVRAAGASCMFSGVVSAN